MTPMINARSRSEQEYLARRPRAPREFEVWRFKEGRLCVVVGEHSDCGDAKKAASKTLGVQITIFIQQHWYDEKGRIVSEFNGGIEPHDNNPFNLGELYHSDWRMPKEYLVKW